MSSSAAHSPHNRQERTIYAIASGSPRASAKSCLTRSRQQVRAPVGSSSEKLLSRKRFSDCARTRSAGCAIRVTDTYAPEIRTPFPLGVHPMEHVRVVTGVSWNKFHQLCARHHRFRRVSETRRTNRLPEAIPLRSNADVTWPGESPSVSPGLSLRGNR